MTIHKNVELVGGREDGKRMKLNQPLPKGLGHEFGGRFLVYEACGHTWDMERVAYHLVSDELVKARIMD